MNGMLVAGRSPSARKRRAWAASRCLTTLGIGVAVCMLIAGALAALSARQDAWRLAEQQSGNLRLALQRDIGRNITIFDLSLQGVIEALAEPGINQAPPGLRHQALFDRAVGAEDLGPIVVLDPKGDVVESSAPLPPGLNLSGRPEYAIHDQEVATALYLSRAFRSGLDHDEPSMSISRRLPSSTGHFAGVVSGALRLSYFQHLFEKMDIGPRGSITLLRTDGHIVWRYPAQDGDMDRDIGESESFQKMVSVPDGEFTGLSVIDGVTRLYCFGRIGSLPLVVSVNFAVDDIYARWRQKAVVIGPVLVMMCVAVVVLSLFFRREMLRRAAAEQALREAAQTLSFMAATDVLTGLANRRTFEVGLNREWRRAVRDRSSVSLLMIDADHFKSFNDRYGHQEGDLALKLIAKEIGDSLLRPADLAARYGGEEFIVLLPGCNALGARMIAERIRAAIEGLNIQHTASFNRCMTVSIGIATALPKPDDRAFDLIKAADVELYVAKRNGRNSVSAAHTSSIGDIECDNINSSWVEDLSPTTS